MLRGVLGWGLAEVARHAPAPPWPGGHRSLEACLMDPQQAWGDPLAQSPWCLQCDDRRTTLEAGALIPGTLLLHGAWPPWAVALLEESLVMGLKRGISAARLPADLHAWQVRPLTPIMPPCPSACRISLRTPARLKDRGEDLDHLHPPALARGLVRRWRQLQRQCSGQDPLTGEEAQALSAVADRLVRLAGEDHPVALERHSNRQQRNHRMDAVEGWVAIGGDALPMLWPWLAMVPHLHVGRQPCFGLGWATIEAFDPSLQG